ncbi:hypothetical protein ABID95_004176, partial [Streptomyces atratus]
TALYLNTRPAKQPRPDMPSLTPTHRHQTSTSHTLTTIDPWWNPPWPILWQRSYHHAHTHPQHPTTRHWLHNQQRSWPLLHPHQQQLLTDIGITA